MDLQSIGVLRILQSLLVRLEGTPGGQPASLAVDTKDYLVKTTCYVLHYVYVLLGLMAIEVSHGCDYNFGCHTCHAEDCYILRSFEGVQIFKDLPCLEAAERCEQLTGIAFCICSADRKGGS